MGTQNCATCVAEAEVDPNKEINVAGYTDPRDRVTRICGAHLTAIQLEISRDALGSNSGLSKKRQRSSTFQGDSPAVDDAPAAAAPTEPAEAEPAEAGANA